MALVLQIARFGVVGIAATVVHLLAALALREAAGWAPLVANLGGFLCANLVSYLGHSRLTFGQALWQGDQLMRFAVAGLSALLVSTVLVWLVTGLGQGSFGLAMILVGLAVPAVNFVVLKFWVFTARPKAQVGPLIQAFPVFLICCVLLAVMWGRMINHDIAWYLIATREWLAGASLYQDIVEVNPPLNFYYTLPAICLADALSLSDQNAQYVVTVALTFGSLVWCQAILRAQFDLSRIKFYLATLVLAAGLILPALFHFGQREHSFILLLMPWLLGQAGDRPSTPRQEILRAVVGGMGVCLKPHFVLIPIAITLLYVIQRRSLRPIFSPANMTFLGVGLAYVAYVAVQHTAYFTIVVPAARDVYGALQPSVLFLVYRALASLVLGGLLSIALLRLKPVGQGGLTLLTAAMAALAIYLVQGMAFPYQILPLNSLLVVAAGLALLRLNPRSLSFWIVGVIGLFLCVAQISRGFFHTPQADEVIEVLRSDPEFKRFMAISSHITVGPGAAMEAGAEWISLYPHNWLVPGAVNRLEATDCSVKVAQCARLNSHLERNRSANIADIQRRPPDLILIDRNIGRYYGYFDRANFSWLDFMAKDPAWADIIAGYEPYKTTEMALYLRAKREPKPSQ